MLQKLKELLRDDLGLPAWAVIAAAGVAAHIAVTIVLRKPLVSVWGLLGPVVLGVAVEAFEIWQQYRFVGLFAPGNDPLVIILLRHALDVAVMCALPLLLVLIGTLSSR